MRACVHSALSNRKRNNLLTVFRNESFLPQKHSNMIDFSHFAKFYYAYYWKGSIDISIVRHKTEIDYTERVAGVIRITLHPLHR